MRKEDQEDGEEKERRGRGGSEAGRGRGEREREEEVEESDRGSGKGVGAVSGGHVVERSAALAQLQERNGETSDETRRKTQKQRISASL